MSDPPPAAAMLGGKARKTCCNGGTNVSKKLLMEFQALIAFACYNSPLIAGGGFAMTESTIEKLIMKLCFGNKDDNNDVVCFVDQFLLGVNKFKGIFGGAAGGSPVQGAVETSPDAVLSVLQFLHRQGNMNISVGEGSIEKRLLIQKSLTNKTPITGRTMLRLAKEVLTNCKKMQALVMLRQSPYKDFHSFPLGSNYDDYLKWCLTAMFLSDEGAIGKSHGCLFCHQNDRCQSNRLTSTTIVPLQVPITIITTPPTGN
jgi:hypothetical protein